MFELSEIKHLPTFKIDELNLPRKRYESARVVEEREIYENVGVLWIVRYADSPLIDHLMFFLLDKTETKHDQYYF
jgi:hypothetical protein